MLNGMFLNLMLAEHVLNEDRIVPELYFNFQYKSVIEEGFALGIFYLAIFFLLIKPKSSVSKPILRIFTWD